MWAEIQRLLRRLPWRQWWPFGRRPRVVVVAPPPLPDNVIAMPDPEPVMVGPSFGPTREQAEAFVKARLWPEEPAPSDIAAVIEEPGPDMKDAPVAPVPEFDPNELNRALRRKYEKLRKQHDKFVEPLGPEPIHTKRDPKPDDIEEEEEEEEAKPIPHIDGPIVPEHLVVDTHHEGGEKVLYEPSEFQGEFNFRDTILDQLERYFVYLRRMKRNDHDGYGLYRQLGGHLVPYAATGTWFGYEWEQQHKGLNFGKPDPDSLLKELPPAFNQNRPAFGCVAYGTSPLDELRELQETSDKKHVLWIPKFLYFHKYDRPPVGRNVVWQPFPDGDNYRLTVWWDRPHDPIHYRRKYGVPQDFAVWISNDGTRIRVLKQKESANVWHYPKEFKSWAKQHGVSVQNYLTHIFIMAVQAHENCSLSMVRVNVHKDDLTAVFGVDPRRLAYFFKDRDVTLNEHGRQHRIFHIIKPHKRKDGAIVKMHFGGEREFTWAGYRVQLTVPGLHHAPLEEFDIPSLGEIKPEEERDGLIDGDAMGTMFANLVRTGRLRVGATSIKPTHLSSPKKAEEKED